MIRLAQNGTEVILDDLGAGLQIVSLTSDGMAIRFDVEPMVQVVISPLVSTIPGTSIPVPFGTTIALDSADLETLPETVVQSGTAVEITWGIRTPFAISILPLPTPSIILVRVKIWIEDDEVVFRSKVDARMTGYPYSLLQVTFPRLRFAPIGDVTTDVLTMPWQQGGLIRNPAQTLGKPPRGHNFPHPSTAVAMQWFAYYSPGGTMAYLRTTDSLGQRKEMEWYAGKTNTLFALTNYPINNGRAGGDPESGWSFEMPYDFRISLMRGSWYDAAKRYRTWALNQPWGKRGPIATAPDFSSLIRDADFTTLRGRTFDEMNESFEPFVEDLLRVKEFLGVAKIASVWGAWNYESFATSFPDYTMKPTFPAAVQRLADEGITVTPYTWRSLWSTASKAYRTFDGANRAAQDAFGHPVLDINPFNGEVIVTIDPTRASSRELAITTWRRLVDESGVRALYTDHWIGLPPQIDGNPELPRTGGPDWQQSKRLLGEMFKAEFKRWNGVRFEDPDFAFASEFVDESVIDLIEIASGFQAKGEVYDSFVPAPLYSTVYHDYGMVAERLMNKEMIPFTPEPWEIATHYHGGRLLAPINPIDDAYLLSRPFESTPHFESWDFIRTLVRSNPVTRRFQLLGEKLRPLPGMLEDALERTGWDGDLMVQGSVWQSGADVGVLLTNAAAEPRVAAVRMLPGRYPMPELGVLVENEGGRRVHVHDVTNTGAIRLDVELPARSLRVFEILPGRPAAVVPGYVMLQLVGHAVRDDLVLHVTEVARAPAAVSVMADVVRLDGTPLLYVSIDGSDDRVTWQTLAVERTDVARTVSIYATSIPTAWVRASLTLVGGAPDAALVRCSLRLSVPELPADAVTRV